MRKTAILLLSLLNALLCVDLLAQKMSLVYDVENTGADCPKPPLLSVDQLPII